MSIIEKAASRIDQQRQNAAATATPPSIVARPARAHHRADAGSGAGDAAPAAGQLPPAERRRSTPAVAAPREAVRSRRRAQRRAPSARTVELDLARMRELGMVTAAGGRTHLLEEFRIIKRPLLKRAFTERGAERQPGNLIMVTSSLPGEGKTYSAINLAMSIAMELDHTVLLVDADVARPSVLRTLGLPAQRGLMDILLDDKLDLADVMLRTNVDTLSHPAGRHQHAARHRAAGQLDHEQPGHEIAQPLSRTASSSSIRRRCC